MSSSCNILLTRYVTSFVSEVVAFVHSILGVPEVMLSGMVNYYIYVTQ